MVTSIANLKNWFKTGNFPTQTQFWAWFDSYRHKNEKVPVAEIEGLNELFSPINNHFNEENAHSQLFLKTKIYFFREFQIFKKEGNEGNNLETGDLVIGFIYSSKFIKAIYNEGEINELSSYTLIEETDF